MDFAQRVVSDDTVKYLLFPDLKNEKSAQLQHEKLEKIAESYILKLSSFLSSYIWQNEVFNLYPTEETPGLPAHLRGSTTFDDNIEDEWFIVYVLFHLTTMDSGLVVKVEDNDGEFLLVEAAEHLPKWISPNTSSNRVYIYQGSLHIIPIASNPSEVTPIPSGTPTVCDAVNAIRQFSSVTKASAAIQQAVKRRIQGYPRKIREFQHKAHCFVPASIAAVLKEDPHLLSAAVKAFYLRDPLDAKVCRAMKYFPPETRVMTEVTFSRCLYAQLLSQKYEPDKRIGWNMPSVNNPNFKAYDLGMKLACGFEILVSSVDKESMDTTDSNVTDMDFNNDGRWKRFVISLRDKGFFRGEIEGSKLHRQLMSQAKEFYLSSLGRKNCDKLPGTRILRLLDTMNVNYEELREAEKSLNPPDDDKWMDITPEQLDSTLDALANGNDEENVASAITGTLKTFLRYASDFEGAEVPSQEKNKKQKVNLDADAFSEAVSNILDFRVPHSDDDSNSSSSMCGYSDDDSDEVELGETHYTLKDNEEKEDPVAAEALFSDMKAYMEQMDRELSKTNVGLSFEKQQPNPTQRDTEVDNDSDDIDDIEDDFKPVDIDLTALKNILESYSSQNGLPGPASNLLGTMNLHLPPDADS